MACMKYINAIPIILTNSIFNSRVENYKSSREVNAYASYHIHLALLLDLTDNMLIKFHTVQAHKDFKSILDICM